MDTKVVDFSIDPFSHIAHKVYTTNEKGEQVEVDWPRLIRAIEALTEALRTAFPAKGEVRITDA